MTNNDWLTGNPAFGEIIVRLLTLKARLDRIEAARRLQSIENTIRLLNK